MVAEIGHGAELASGGELVDQRFDQLVAGVVALHVANHEALPGFALCLEDGVGLDEGDRHRLLHEDILAGEQGLARELTLDGEGGGDSHGLDVGVGEQLLVVAVEPGDAESLLYLAAKLGAQLGEGEQAHLRHRREVRQVHALRHEAAADVSDAKWFQRSPPAGKLFPINAGGMVTDERQGTGLDVAAQWNCNATCGETGVEIPPSTVDRHSGHARNLVPNVCSGPHPRIARVRTYRGAAWSSLGSEMMRTTW